MKTIEEGNKLIAEFMGIVPIVETNGIVYKDTNTGHIMLIKYHSSWDWLMPVVEKIEKTTQCDIIIHAKNVVDASYNSQTQLYYAGSLLQNAWQAVVEFIEWYNNH